MQETPATPARLFPRCPRYIMSQYSSSRLAALHRAIGSRMGHSNINAITHRTLIIALPPCQYRYPPARRDEYATYFGTEPPQIIVSLCVVKDEYGVLRGHL